MTEAEAIVVIVEQFTSPEGLVSRLQNLGGIDQGAVDRTWEALDALHAAWRAKDSVPKNVVLPMLDVASRVYDSAELYSGAEHDEVEDLANELRERIARLFGTTAPASMTEEEAMAVVWAHFNGVHSFALALHEREGLDRDSLENVQTALDTIASAWAARSYVPKAIAGSMIDARSLIWGNAGWYPQQQTELSALADDLSERVRRCLS